MNNPESLRAKLIEALEHYPGRGMAEQIFEQSIWPVLDAAMTAGELLVARNTEKVEQKPVHQALRDWLNGCLSVIKTIHEEEDTISKGRVLKTLYQLEMSAYGALRDADALAQVDDALEKALKQQFSR